MNTDGGSGRISRWLAIVNVSLRSGDDGDRADLHQPAPGAVVGPLDVPPLVAELAAHVAQQLGEPSLPVGLLRRSASFAADEAGEFEQLALA